jgi:hypothetical protein
MNVTKERIRLKVEDLPELDTEVAIFGSSKHQEVGGVACVAVAAGVLIVFGL